MIELRGLSFSGGSFRLDNISLSVRAGEYFVVLGPTGAGKTMLIECIAGLHKNPPGSVLIDGKDVSARTPEERGLGYVPQDYALFPFLSVQDNIRFPLNIRGRRDSEAMKAFDEVVEQLQIGALLDRDIQNLSGGERQRVALARALVIRPRLLLLDEPYSALHTELRQRLWAEMKIMHSKLGTTVIHVTHDLDEAFALGERAAVIMNGRLEQTGTRYEIFRKPSTREVATFLGVMSILSGEVARVDSGLGCMILRAAGHEFLAPMKRGLSIGDRVDFCVRTDQIRMLENEPADFEEAGASRLRARVVVSV
ncbi:MAG: ATP-binding cassette domain-containing protein [Planctomycetota bacterium]|nr:ATP-binding cassette domain-containing protein [Planctomycetota bacterium]